jgi:hypothetical protein
MADASLRDAARTLAVPLTSLRRLIEAEPTLRACVRPAGPRRSAAVDLPGLVAAWQRLQAATPQQSNLSPRQQLAIERRRRLWWQAECLRLEVEQTDRGLMVAAEVAAVERRCLQELEEALAAWLDLVAPQLPGMAGDEAQQLLQRSTVATLEQLAAQQRPEPPVPPPPAPAPLPEPLPAEDTLRALVERYRGDLHQLKAQASTGLLMPAAEAINRASNTARRCRDQFLALTARFAPAARHWRNETQVRAQLGQEVSRITGGR